jgi:hypothetical protein
MTPASTEKVDFSQKKKKHTQNKKKYTGRITRKIK